MNVHLPMNILNIFINIQNGWCLLKPWYEQCIMLQAVPGIVDHTGLKRAFVLRNLPNLLGEDQTKLFLDIEVWYIDLATVTWFPMDKVFCHDQIHIFAEKICKPGNQVTVAFLSPALTVREIMTLMYVCLWLCYHHISSTS